MQQSVLALNRTFPNNTSTPSGLLQLREIGRVACDVSGNLLLPKRVARRWPPKHRAIVAVPKAPVDEDYRTVFCEDEIGLTWQIRLVKPEPKTLCMQPTPDQYFRLGILRPDRRHVAASGRAVVDVSQLS